MESILLGSRGPTSLLPATDKQSDSPSFLFDNLLVYRRLNLLPGLPTFYGIDAGLRFYGLGNCFSIVDQSRMEICESSLMSYRESNDRGARGFFA